MPTKCKELVLDVLEFIWINHTSIHGAGGVIVGDAGQSPSEMLARDLAQHLYETAKLSVGGLDPKELANFQTNNLQLMSRLMERGI